MEWCCQKSMIEICENGCYPTDQNHCAHFVSHVLNLQFGTVCGDLAGERHTGASVRCDELYSYTHVTEQVRRDATVDAFRERMSAAYKSDGDDIPLYYGVPL